MKFSDENFMRVRRKGKEVGRRPGAFGGTNAIF